MDARRGPFEEFAIATAVLTRLPAGIEVPGEQGAIAASGWAFSLVGAGIGGLPALAFLVAELLGCSSTVAAWLAVLVGGRLTRAFHEDRLADTPDRFRGGDGRGAELALIRAR